MSGPTFRGANRILFLGVLLVIGIAFYVLVATHHVKLPAVLERLSSAVHSHQAPRGIVKNKQWDPTSPGAVFAAKMMELGAFRRYDTDHDGHLNVHEFQDFLTELGRSRVLPDALRDNPDILAKGAAAAAAGGSSSEDYRCCCRCKWRVACAFEWLNGGYIR